jgi:hypothetical protein
MADLAEFEQYMNQLYEGLGHAGRRRHPSYVGVK